MNNKKENEILKIMQSLNISRKEAEEVWEDDNSDKLTPEQAELEKKAKTIKNYTQSEKAHNKGKKRERKINENKLEILKEIQTIIGGEIEKEIAIHFEKGGKKYTLKLIEHR